MCEQLAQGHYMKAEQLGVETAAYTSWVSRFSQHTAVTFAK